MGSIGYRWQLVGHQFPLGVEVSVAHISENKRYTMNSQQCGKSEVEKGIFEGKDYKRVLLVDLADGSA